MNFIPFKNQDNVVFFNYISYDWNIYSYWASGPNVNQYSQRYSESAGEKERAIYHAKLKWDCTWSPKVGSPKFFFKNQSWNSGRFQVFLIQKNMNDQRCQKIKKKWQKWLCLPTLFSTKFFLTNDRFGLPRTCTFILGCAIGFSKKSRHTRGSLFLILAHLNPWTLLTFNSRTVKHLNHWTPQPFN